MYINKYIFIILRDETPVQGPQFSLGGRTKDL